MAGSAASQTPPTTAQGQFLQQLPQNPTQAANDFEKDEPFSATYVGADVRAVVNEMLGDFLGIPFTIAPDVAGAVTMRVENVRSRLATIDLLRSALQPLGIAVVDRGELVAVGRATGQAEPTAAAVILPGQPSPSGGGVVALAPRFIAPSQLSPLLTPFAGNATVLATDDNRRFLLIRGDEASITAASSAAAMFDVDWFSQVASASFRLEHVRPQDAAAELRSLMGPSAPLIDFVPIPRLRRLIVLARSPELLQSVETQLKALDVPSSSQSAGLLVYRARHADAATLARSFGGSPAALPPADASPMPVPDPDASSRPDRRDVPGSDFAQQLPFASSDAAAGQELSVSVNREQNAVIVRGDASQLADARALLEELDQPIPQVLIEAAIVEVTLNDELEFGVNWRGVEDRLVGTFTDAATGAVARRFPGLSVTYVNTDIEAALNLLASVTKVEVVSRPSIMAINNAVAELQVGDEVPIVTQTAISVTDPDAPIVNQTTYRNTGVILTVIPSVRTGGVELKIAQEVSQVARTTSSGIDSPTIQQRRLESTLMVPSGEAVALGGLISATRTRGVTGVPLLKDIPLLGQLFRSNSNLVERTELLVFLTPRVLLDGRAAVDATTQLRGAFRKLEAELGAR